MADRILYERPWCSIILHSKHKIRFVLTNHVTRIDMVRIYLPFVLFIAVRSIIIVLRCWYDDDRSNGDRKQFYPRDRNLRYHSYETIFIAMISKISTYNHCLWSNDVFVVRSERQTYHCLWQDWNLDNGVLCSPVFQSFFLRPTYVPINYLLIIINYNIFLNIKLFFVILIFM